LALEAGLDVGADAHLYSAGRELELRLGAVNVDRPRTITST
jgi:hypothetical protein